MLLSQLIAEFNGDKIMSYERIRYEVQAESPNGGKFYTVATRMSLEKARAERKWRDAPNEVLDALIGSTQAKHRIIEVVSTCKVIE